MGVQSCEALWNGEPRPCALTVVPRGQYRGGVATVDSHLHLITASMLRRSRERMPAYRQKAVESARVRGKTFEERLAEPEGRSLEDHARSWLAEFDQAGVDTGAFLGVGEGNGELARVVARTPKRL